MATMLILRALTGELRGQEFTLHGTSYWLLGRASSCQVQLLGDAMVSRQHCLIGLEGEATWVQDLGSLNGTHVNGQKIGRRQKEHRPEATTDAPLRQELHDGDELRLCSHVFAVVLSDRPREHVAPSAERHEAATRKGDTVFSRSAGEELRQAVLFTQVVKAPSRFLWVALAFSALGLVAGLVTVSWFFFRR
jgi:pSer/pThr/pTyr-binding forkhead associated (FHA) protein